MTRLADYVLPLARLLVALTSDSYIHPDSHFQALEPMLGDLLSFQSGDPMKTWEWTGQQPIRNIVWPFLTALPILLVKLLAGESQCSFRVLLWAPRVVSWMMGEATFLLMSVTAKRAGYGKLSPWAYVSLVPFSFLLRPFSSTPETLLLASLIFCVVDIAQYPVGPLAKHRLSPPTLLLLCGAITSLGIFVRVTFVTFAIAPLQCLLWELLRSRDTRQSNRPGSDPSSSMPSLLEPLADSLARWL
jgi:phosphatidylinositol glycan class Z